MLAAASVLLTGCANQPRSAASGREADALSVLSDRAYALAREDEFSGAVLVAKDGRVLFSRAYGLADRERRIPNTVRTRFRIGSMTKMFTAVAILQLVEAGKVKLTAPLGTYLPDYPNREVATEVTIDQLLTHTSGLGELPWPDFYAHRNELRTLADYVSRYAQRVRLEFQPGSRWVYSNYGFLLLGLVIEKVTGQSYYKYVEQQVYAPAGMTRSGSLPENQAVPDLAIGYTKPWLPYPWVPSTDQLPYRASSFAWSYSTVGDLARFAQALLSHKLLNPETTRLLITGKAQMTGEADAEFGPGVKTMFGPATRYAYGFVDAPDASGNGWVGAGGADAGMSGDLRIYLKSGYVVAVLANIDLNIDVPAAPGLSAYLDPWLPTAE